MALNFAKAEFVRSAGRREDFIRDGLPQFAFAGRSNVGKSSVINRLVGRKNLAYVGASPGKTTQVNYFLIDRRAYLVDLPGYGYAKVSQAEKERWAKLMESYFQEEADRITTGVLIVDIRHKPTANDLVMHDWFRQTGCPEIVVANKLDKLKKSQVEPALQLVRETLELTEADILLPFSAVKGMGKEDLIRLLVQTCGGYCGKRGPRSSLLPVRRTCFFGKTLSTPYAKAEKYAKISMIFCEQNRRRFSSWRSLCINGSC